MSSYRWKRQRVRPTRREGEPESFLPVFPGCASGRLCFLHRDHRVALSWGNPRQNPERLLQGGRGGTGKLALGRRGGRSRYSGAHTARERDREEETKREAHMHARISFPILTFHKRLRGSPAEYFGCRFSWNAELMPGSSTDQPALSC